MSTEQYIYTTDGTTTKRTEAVKKEQPVRETASQ